MKLFLIIGGLFIIIFICLLPLPRKISEYRVEKSGKIISATISYIPHCYGTKVKYFMRFVYNGEEFDKKVGCGFGDNHKAGDIIKLNHNEGKDIFLFENEKIEQDFFSTIGLALLSLFLIIYGLKRKALTK